MVESRRHSLDEEEAEGLLYSDEHHYHDEKQAPSRYHRLTGSRLVRIIAIVLALGATFWFLSSTGTRQSAAQQSQSATAVSAKPTIVSTAIPSTSATTIGQAAPSPTPEQSDGTADVDDAVCDFARCVSKTFTFSNLRNFELRNLIEPTERGDLFRNSWIRLVPGAEDQKDDIIVDVTFNTTDATLAQFLDMRSTDSSLLMIFPTAQPPSLADASRQFIETQTKIYFRSALKFDQVTIESSILGINIPEPIDIWTESANLTCTAGSLMADPMINARYAFMTMDAGTILGTFPLYEALALESDAGRINAKIVPQDHKKEHGIHAARASLVVQSSAGDVDIHYKTKHGVPERDYTVNIQTDFGRITGKYLHGSYTSLRTVMGDIKAKILPMAADRDESELVTYTHAGKQSITVLEPYYDTTTRLARLESSHESKLGSIDVVYPKAWEGTVEAVSKMGSVELDDGNGHNDLQIIREQRSLLGVLVEAEKGQGEGSVVCGTERGDVKFSVAS